MVVNKREKRYVQDRALSEGGHVFEEPKTI